jgi:DNA helicase-2/ATP-dependent DNA helicase PcrA
MKRDDLDCRQREVIEAVLQSDARILVLGRPGTGKTTTALWTAREFLEASPGVPAPRVLFLTFSRSAVSQIMSRSPGVITGYSERVEILTFHSLAYRVLRAFGRYAGYGMTGPTVQSEARTRLLGRDHGRLTYDDLIPGAIGILKRSERIRYLLSTRWGLVICDEAQDTNPEQWQLLQLVAGRKLLLLGDGSQLIYTFIPGVSLERFQKMKEWADRVIELKPRSHRDPSGAIPALAEAVRLRQFEHQAILDALRTGRLVIHFDVDGNMLRGVLTTVIREAIQRRERDVGVFAHSNVAVAELAEQLDAAGIEHVLIGIPEAHAEALASMATQCAFAVGLATSEEVRQSLALFLTATVRSQQAPQLARALLGDAPLPELVQNAVLRLEVDLAAAVGGSIEDLSAIAIRSWETVGIQAGFRPWRRAAGHFRRLVAPLRHREVSQDSVRLLMEIVERSRIEALIDLDYSERGRVKLMNYHQTKGREADVVIHVFRPDDYFGSEVEPFEETSRLLNVAISRARQRVIILLPPNPHPLVEPFTALRRYAR